MNDIVHADAVNHPDLLDAKTVASRLDVSRATVVRMASDGRIAAIKAPGYCGSWLFDPAEVERVRGASKVWGERGEPDDQAPHHQSAKEGAR